MNINEQMKIIAGKKLEWNSNNLNKNWVEQWSCSLYDEANVVVKSMLLFDWPQRHCCMLSECQRVTLLTKCQKLGAHTDLWQHSKNCLILSNPDRDQLEWILAETWHKHGWHLESICLCFHFISVSSLVKTLSVILTKISDRHKCISASFDGLCHVSAIFFYISTF